MWCVVHAMVLCGGQLVGSNQVLATRAFIRHTLVPHLGGLATLILHMTTLQTNLVMFVLTKSTVAWSCW